MAAQLANHLRALASFMTTVRETPAFADVAKAQEAHFTMQMASLTFSVEEANMVMEALRAVPWPGTVAKSLVELVASKTSATSDQPSSVARTAMQDYRCMYHYFTQEQWAKLMAEGIFWDKVDMILQHCIRLGLRCPSEGTVQSVCALAMAVHEGLEQAGMHLPSEKHTHFLHCKSAFKRLIKTSRPSTFLSVLPPSVATFKESFRSVFDSVFSEVAPVQCPLNMSALERLSQSIPMRKTNKDIANNHVGTIAMANNSATMQQQMLQMMQFMMQQQQQQHQQPGGRLNIRFLNPSSSSGNPSSTSGSLALPPIAPKKDKEEEEEDGEQPVAPKKKEEEDEQPMAEEIEDSSVAPPSAQASGKYRGPKLSVAESLKVIKAQLDKRDEAGKKQGKGKAKAKAKGKAKGKGKGKSKANILPTVEPIIKSKAKDKPKGKGLPKLSIEWSRNQVLCRGVGGSHVIKFDANGDHTPALEQGEKWLKKELAKLG